MEEREIQGNAPVKKKKKRKKKRYLLKFCILALAVFGAYKLLSSSLFDIQRITIENNA
jgi:hypothetical protein